MTQLLISSPPQNSALLLAKNLLLLRTAIDHTQQSLADSSQVSRATIAQVEAGATDPRLSTLDLLADTLGVSTAFLLFSRRELEALVALLALPPDPAPPANTLAVLRALLLTPAPRRQLEASRMGIVFAQRLGLTEPAHALGAALAAAHAPGRAIPLLAHFAALLSSDGPTPRTEAVL